MAENRTRFPAFVGPSNTTRSGRFDCERTVNMYLEKDALGSGKGEEPAMLIGSPGLKLLQNMGAGPVRKIHVPSSNLNLVYIVSGNQVFMASSDFQSVTTCVGNAATSGKATLTFNGYVAPFTPAYPLQITSGAYALGVSIDGGAAANHVVTATGSDTMTSMAALLTTSIGVPVTAVGNAWIVTSTTTGTASSIVVTPPTTGKNLLTSIVSALATINPTTGANTSNQGAIAGTGVLLTQNSTVSIADNGQQLMIVDGLYGYYIPIGSNVLTQIVDVHFYPSNTIDFQDGYFILNQIGTGYFFISNLYDVTFPPLNEANKSGSGDNLVGIICNNRQLILFGTRTTEVWWDSGGTGAGITPFTRQEGQYSQVGCLAPQTIRRLATSVVWLGQNEQGGAVVYELQNGQAVRISNHAVEFALQSLGDVTTSSAYTYQEEGHVFYVLNPTNSTTTWVYDLSTQQWTERQSILNGTTGRHLANHHVFFGARHIVGDYQSGNVYESNLNYYTDNGAPIPRIRQSPHVSQSLNRMFYSLFELDLEFGVGLSGDISYQTNGMLIDGVTTLQRITTENGLVIRRTP
jgi:hypothetical protein